MSTSIYFFTGTGNSMAIAREVADRLSAGLIPIQSVVGREDILPDTDCVGIVFPVYNHRIPYIVKRFAEKLADLEHRYVFAVCTYGDSVGISLEYLSGLIEAGGGKLAAGFGVKMPYNYINPSKGLLGVFRPFVLRELPIKLQEQLLSEGIKKIDEICSAVKLKRSCAVEVEFRRLEHAIDFLNLRETLQKSVWLKVGGFRGTTGLSYMESIRLMDCGFHREDGCVHCGICAGICPTGNIAMTEDGPEWMHRCEQCFACLQWCPKNAVQYGKGTAGGIRYHHPDITLDDMLENNKFRKGRISNECSD